MTKRVDRSYALNDPLWKSRLLNWAGDQDRLCLLDSSQHPQNEPSSAIHSYLAVGALEEIVIHDQDAFAALRELIDRTGDWLFGYLAYDLKNQLEDLVSENADGLEMPLMHFFRPDWLFKISAAEIHIAYDPAQHSAADADQLWATICATPSLVNDPDFSSPPEVENRITRDEYLARVRKLKEHIRYGDIYEVNFCQEFYAETQVDPLPLYQRLNRISPTPFSCFYRLNEHHLLCGSPERFIRKQGTRIISQPIKGTAPRGKTPEEDQVLKETLYHNPKDRSENVMIVDLVRNDLSHIAAVGSVQVDELFGIYSFPKVHQMISTVSCTLRENKHVCDALSNTFPMGSMTGAPKIRAMELIEQYESTKRGLYSGAVGYIDPDGNFDFNVVIRSMLYNAQKQYLSFMVGGAIIDASDPEMEYEECLLKAKAIFETLNARQPVAEAVD